MQVLHEYDSCCFRAAGLEKDIIKYNKFIQDKSGINGWMQTIVTRGNWHEVNLRDKTLVNTMIEKFRMKNGMLDKDDFKNLPFDILQVDQY
jgi:hypothetical protein|tara:strand:- start:144 stop:416 length:273 start_codon:yes stop_codon:yes gene_type:complete